VGGLAAADSAVGRLVMMIQRLTDPNQRHLPAAPHLYQQATPPRPPMTSSGDVTSSRDPCHGRPTLSKSLSLTAVIDYSLLCPSPADSAQLMFTFTFVVFLTNWQINRLSVEHRKFLKQLIFHRYINTCMYK